MSTFKASAFRQTTGVQYGNELWFKSLGTIATPATEGLAVAMKALYLEDGDEAIPTIIGSLSWKTPTDDTPSQCAINVFNGLDVTPAMTLDMNEANLYGDCRVVGTVYAASGSMSGGLTVDGDAFLNADCHVAGTVYAASGSMSGGLTVDGDAFLNADCHVTGTVYAASGSMSGLTVDGGVFLPSIGQDPGAYTMLTWDPSTGEVKYMPISGAANNIDSIDVLTINEDLRLPNAPTFRTPYALYLEPLTGSIRKATTPYTVTEVGGVVDSVAFAANVTAANVSTSALNVSGNTRVANFVGTGATTLNTLTVTNTVTCARSIVRGNITAGNVSTNVITATAISATSLSVSDNVVASNVVQSLGNVEAGHLIQIGSGSEVWRLRPDAATGSLAIEKWQAGAWVPKSLIGTL